MMACKQALRARFSHTPLPPSALLDLHLAFHLRRRVNADSQIDFLGCSWPIAQTKRLTVSLIHHPLRQFWAVLHPPLPPLNTWPQVLGNYSLSAVFFLNSRGILLLNSRRHLTN